MVLSEEDFSYQQFPRCWAIQLYVCCVFIRDPDIPGLLFHALPLDQLQQYIKYSQSFKAKPFLKKFTACPKFIQRHLSMRMSGNDLYSETFFLKDANSD